MDEYSNKSIVGGLGFNRRGSSIAFRSNHESRSIQSCNRLSCSTRHDSLTGTQTGKPEKLKLSRPAFLSTSSRTTVGSASGVSSSLKNHGKSQRVRRNTSSLQERVSLESTRRQVQEEYIESNITQEVTVKLDVDPTAGGTQMVPPETKHDQSFVLQEFPLNMAEASKKCQLTSSSRDRKPNSRKIESGNEGAASSSPVRHSVVPRNASHIIKPSQNQVANTQKHGLRNLSCTSISDVLPSGCSSSDIHQNRRTDTLRKRYIDGESSAAKGKRIVGSSKRGNTDSARNGPSGLSLLEQPSAQLASRTRNQLTGRDRALSVRTRRSVNGDSRTRFSERSDDNTFLLPESLIIPSSQAEISINEAATASSSQSFPTYMTPICQSYSGRPGSSSGTTRPRPTAHSDDSDTRVSHDPWVHRDAYRRLNMEGIEEVLLALDRIEQDEELTYEQLMVLQSNLFLGGLGFHDQHRDWRLDIDNMTYEELLALEEKMGTVSTALSEEELSKCIRRSLYSPISISDLEITCRDTDDVKCSICQEEYIVGDEVGKLLCGHRYHMTCIHQWLRQKNWCPICKSSACPS